MPWFVRGTCEEAWPLSESDDMGDDHGWPKEELDGTLLAFVTFGGEFIPETEVEWHEDECLSSDEGEYDYGDRGEYEGDEDDEDISEDQDHRGDEGSDESEEVLLAVIVYTDRVQGILGPTMISLIVSEEVEIFGYSLSNLAKPVVSFTLNASKNGLDPTIDELARATVRMKNIAERAGMELIGMAEVDHFLAELARERVLHQTDTN